MGEEKKRSLSNGRLTAEEITRLKPCSFGSPDRLKDAVVPERIQALLEKMSRRDDEDEKA
jgi:hypothetical protein